METITVLEPVNSSFSPQIQGNDSNTTQLKAGERKFSIRSDQMAASEINEMESVLWTREFPALITSASVGKELSVWGLMDGRLLILDGNGALVSDNPDIQALNLTNQLDACIYGVGISPDGSSLIVLFGRNPQYLIAFKREWSGYKVITTLKMKEAVLTSSQITFSSDGYSALARTGEGLLFFDARKTRFSQVMPADRTRNLRIFPKDTDGYTVLLSGDSGMSAMVVRSNLSIATVPVESTVIEFMLDDSIVKLRSLENEIILRLGRR